MKKPLLLFSFALIFSFFPKAQTWEKDLHFPVVASYGHVAMQKFDYKPAIGSSLVALYNSPVGNYFLYSLNDNGDTLWGKQIKFDSTIWYSVGGGYTSAITSDKKHILYGNLTDGSYNYKSFLLVFDSLGNKLSYLDFPTSIYGSMFAYVLSPASDPANYFLVYKNDTSYVSGSDIVEEPRIFVQKRNISGTIIWSTVVSCSSTTIINGYMEMDAATLTKDGGLAMVYSEPCSGNDYWVRKFDGATGTTIFQTNVASYFPFNALPTASSLIALPDSGLVTTINYQNYDSTIFFRLDKNGTITSTKNFYHQIMNSGFEKSNDGNLFFPYFDISWASPIPSSGIIETDLDGNTLNTYLFPFSQNTNYYNKAFANAVGGGMVAINIYDGTPNYYHVHLVNFDSLLTIYPGKINGQLVLDNDQNCVYSGGDHGISNGVVEFTDTSGALFYSISNPGGNYSCGLPFGSYSATHLPHGYKGVECPASAYSLQISNDTTIAGISFYDTLTSNINDLSLSLYSDNMVPGFDSYLYAYVTNQGTVQSAATAYIVIDTALNFISALPTPSLVSGDTLFFNFPVFNADSSLNISVLIHTDSFLPLTTPYLFAGGISNTGADLTPADNTDSLGGIVMGAFDPNDKSVNQPKYINDSPEMIYRIRFQNTGTLPAHTVTLIDTLSAELDLLSLKPISASHNYTLQLLQDRRMIIRFNNIMLPDSFSNEPASHGYFTYRIKPSANFQLNDKIENTAYIYFDYNPPVITNTTLNIFGTNPVGISESNSNGKSIDVFPNPAQNILYVHETNGKKTESLLLMDAAGKIVLSKRSDQNFVSLDVSDCANGIYFLKIKIDSGQVQVKKIVIAR